MSALLSYEGLGINFQYLFLAWLGLAWGGGGGLGGSGLGGVGAVWGGGGGACTPLYNQNPFFTTRIPTSQPTSFSGIPTLQPAAKAS